MTVEIELKFQVPAERLVALRRALATTTAQREVLAARYFDTDAQDLARAHVALRLRREGRRWVQTLKAEGASTLVRLEHDVPLPGTAVPVLDIVRHVGTEAGERLSKVLSRASDGTLLERYATRVNRLKRRVRHLGAVIELALDVGELRSADRALPIRELEFELISGPPQALPALAARWVERHGLVLDLRSKSERGSLLAAGLSASAPVMATPLRLASDLSPAQAVQEMLRNTLAQMLPNACQVAAGGHGEDHVHQLRVGLRRLRSAVRLFGPAWADIAPMADAPALVPVMAALGTTRDRDVMAATLWPALRAAGAPTVELPEVSVEPGATPESVLRAPDTQRLWLELLRLSLIELPPAKEGGDLAALLMPPLRRLQHQVRRDARRFEKLDDAARHRLRRRIKRLRYGLEFLSTLLPRRKLARQLANLRLAQERLGECNDCSVAIQAYRAHCALDPRAWFAVGWLTSLHEQQLGVAALAMKPVAKHPHRHGDR